MEKIRVAKMNPKFLTSATEKTQLSLNEMTKAVDKINFGRKYGSEHIEFNIRHQSNPKKRIYVCV